MDSKSAKILVVDDFEMIRMMLKTALGEIGPFQVDEAENGKIALEMLTTAVVAKKPYSMVFCDWTMPEMSGLEVLQLCRKSNIFKLLPFVMVTAESDHESVVQAIKSGANDYLIKPISKELLEKKIQKILAKIDSKAA